MKMSIFERSECFRGFLLLVAQDGVISRAERDLLLHIGRVLDFDAHFCENAMSDILENNYISREPPVFSRREFAETFLRDALMIAVSDKELHPSEFQWLASIAEKNGLEEDWLEVTKKDVSGRLASGLRRDVLSIAEFI